MFSSFPVDGLYVTNSALHYKFSGKATEQYAPYHIGRISMETLVKVWEIKNPHLYGENGEKSISELKSDLLKMSGQ